VNDIRPLTEEEQAEIRHQATLYPYPFGTELNWAWMATSIGAVGAATAAAAEATKRGKTANPLVVGAAALIGGWLGAKLILPA
jgi:hypothetical protein